MRVIPVLDLKAGLAVAAGGGDRDAYPLLSGTPEACNPLAWARRFAALLQEAQVPEPAPLYVADLDAIEGAEPHYELLQSIAEIGLGLWIDAGVIDSGDVPPLFEAGAEAVVVGLETISSPEALASIVALFGPDRILFSLDLKGGRPLTAPDATWPSDDDPGAIALTAIRGGIRRLLLIDLDRVGTGRGSSFDRFLPALRDAANVPIELTVGGGIAGPTDLERLEGFGADGVLVGSALRDGRLKAAHVRAYV